MEKKMSMKKKISIKQRLEYLRGEIKKERISYREILELQSLKEHIKKGDVELLQWAGVSEFEEENAMKEYVVIFQHSIIVSAQNEEDAKVRGKILMDEGLGSEELKAELE